MSRSNSQSKTVDARPITSSMSSESHLWETCVKIKNIQFKSVLEIGMAHCHRVHVVRFEVIACHMQKIIGTSMPYLTFNCSSS